MVKTSSETGWQWIILFLTGSMSMLNEQNVVQLQDCTVYGRLKSSAFCVFVLMMQLRILDIHGTKTHKNQTPLARLPQ